MKEQKDLPGAHLPGPTPAGGPACHRYPPLSPSSSARRTGTRPARAATRPGHLLPASATSCLPACLHYSLETPRGSLRPLSTPSRAHPLLLLSLSLRTSDRTEPSPPTPFAAATIPLSPPRRLPELRSASLDLLDVSRDQKGPEQPPSSSSPSFGPGAVFRRIRPLRRAPELADPPCTIPVSPCFVSP